MPTQTGRACVFRWNAVAIQGCREKALAVNNSPIDITSDDDAGWQNLFTEAGQRDVKISISGVAKTDVLKIDAFSPVAANRSRSATLTYSNGAIVSGTFLLSTYNEGTPYKDAITFDCELMSVGPVTFTPGS